MSFHQALVDGLTDEGAAAALDAAEFGGWLLLTLLLGRYVVEPVVERALALRGPSETFAQAARRTVHLAIGLVAVVVAVVASGYGGVLAGSGLVIAAATVAISVAAQDVIRNLVSGAFLVADRDVGVGDYVEWNDRGGVIVDIGFRASRVRTAENAILTVPNATLATTTVSTPYLGNRYMVTEEFTVGLDDDVGTAADVMEAVALDHERTMDRPEPTVYYGPVSDGTVGLSLYYWVQDPERLVVNRVRSAVVDGVVERAAEAGVTLAPPSGRELSGSVRLDGEEEP